MATAMPVQKNGIHLFSNFRSEPIKSNTQILQKRYSV